VALYIWSVKVVTWPAKVWVLWPVSTIERLPGPSYSAGAGLTSFVTGVIEAWQPFVRAFGEIVEKILEFGDETFRTMGQVAGFGQAINVIASNIGLLTGGLNAISSALRLLSITQIPSAIGAVGRLTTSIGIGGIAGGGLIAPVLLLGSAFALIPNSPLRNLVDQIPAINNLTTAIDNFYLRLRGINAESNAAAQSQGEYNRQLGIAAVQAHDLLDEMDRIDEQNEDLMLSVAIDMDLTSFFTDIDQAKFVLDDMADKNIEVTAEVNETSFEQAEQYIIETAEDGITTIVFAQPDQTSFEDTREEIEELPSEKELEIRLQGDIDRELAIIEAQAETIQTSMEWTARIDIAEVEAASDTIIAMSGNVADMFANTGSVMVGMADALSELSSYDRLQLFELLENEARNRAQLLEMEANLTQAQVDYLNARTESLERGGGVVTIEANNIEPELQLVLHRIIELTQIAANEQGLEFLIGV